jgi:hypothetical protein
MRASRCPEEKESETLYFDNHQTIELIAQPS